MKKRRFFTILTIFACIASVVGGQIYYNKKLEKTAYAAKRELADKPIGATEKTNESVKICIKKISRFKSVVLN